MWVNKKKWDDLVRDVEILQDRITWLECDRRAFRAYLEKQAPYQPGDCVEFVVTGSGSEFYPKKENMIGFISKVVLGGSFSYVIKNGDSTFRTTEIIGKIKLPKPKAKK